MLYLPLPQPTYTETSNLHIPDGFLNAPVSIVFYVLAAVFVSLAIRQTNRSLGDKAAPLMGVLAAFIFAGQMINFPVAGGTSGHLLGGTLAAILIGPWAAIIAMTAVISVQALIFQDGGIAVLGANVFNMGVATALIGYAVYMAAIKTFPDRPSVRLGGAFAAAWLSVMAAAILTTVQLAISDTSPLDVALPAMMGVHALIGMGEGLITAAAVAFVLTTRPDLVESANGSASPRVAEARP
jgi:cobalt/nickel transport system permease protein